MNDFIISQITRGDTDKLTALRANTEAVEVAVSTQSSAVRRVLVIVFLKPCPEFPDVSGGAQQVAQVLTIQEVSTSLGIDRKVTSHNHAPVNVAASTYGALLKAGAVCPHKKLAMSLWTAITGKPHPHA